MQIVLGKYEIRAKISKGPMSTVYDGWDTAIDRRVAIKAVPLAQTNEADGWQHLTRFRREAQAAGRLQHPTVVAIFDYGETAESAFIVMEFVEGGTLKAALEAGTRFTIGEVNRLMQDILAGLQYSHDRGIVHRDIKPANIMLTGDGHAKIADFGIARVEHSDITQVGMIMGTPAYMSPEQFNGEAIGPSTDIYSAGVILYQLLTGERPFDGGLATIMHRALSTEPPKPSDISRTAPRSVDGVVARAMAKQPDRRFNDAKGFAQALDDALALKQPDPAIRSIAAQKVPGPSRRATTPSFLYPVTGALLIVLAGAGYWLLAPSAALTTRDVRGPTPPTQTAATPAAPSPPKEASQASSATPAASPDPAGPDPRQVAPMRPPADQSTGSREAPSAQPTVASAQPVFPAVSLPLTPDLSGREPLPNQVIYPLAPVVPAPGASNAQADPPRARRGPPKDDRSSSTHPPSRQPVETRTDGNSAIKAPWKPQLDRYRAESRSKDAPDDADPVKPPTSDTPAPGPRRTPLQNKKVTADNLGTPDAGVRSTPNPSSSGLAQPASSEHDTLAAPPPEATAPPRIFGTYGIRNGVRGYIPPPPDPAK